MENRVKAILNAIVESYIQTAEPVGSRTLSKQLDIGLSPATIRNVMADLSEQGYLEQPHTSAGRIPTDKAYRFFVDSLVTAPTLSDEIRAMIDEAVGESTPNLEKMLANTTKVLAGLTQFTGVVAAPRVNTTCLKLIEFIKMSSRQIFIVLISQSNMVHNKIIDVSEDFSQEFLNSVARFLNAQFGERSLMDIRSHVLETLVEEKEQYDQLLAQAARLSKKAFDISDDRELYVEGQYNIVKDFQDIGKFQRLLKALEEKIAILDILDRTLTAKGVHIYIGTENSLDDLQDCSVITANYGNGSQVLGALGVIGPTRMDYFRIIPIINYTAKILTQSITAG